MLRLLYRHFRRRLTRRFINESAARELLSLAPKWWFDFARNLILTSLFAYFAVKSGKWYAYVLAHISFVFLFLFLFGPIFAAAFFRSRHSKRATVFSVFMILNILSLAMGAMLLLTYVLAQLQAR
jgi:hypothetical protein